MADGAQGDQNIHAENNSIAFGGISVGGDVGDIRIGHTIGYTSEQVSTLITQISTTFQVKPFDGRSPYKGLDVFEEEDSEMFFGRERLVQDLVSRVKESTTVFVTGPSGSGKSSLVRAGLIHALKQGCLTEVNSDRWLYATLKPGRDPFEGLKNAFSRLKSPELGNYFLSNVSKPDVLHECAESALSERKDQRLFLFIDQFEEIFTQISREDERVQLLDLVTHAPMVENGRVILVFAMRSDFVSNCATYPRLNALLNQQFVQIGAMQPDELVSAIAQPALRVGLRIDPDLIAQIINDMEGEPGSLPLMQFALKDLFDTRQEKGGIIALTLSDYLERGGIRKALERHANKTFADLEADEQELARSIFTGLIEIGRGTQDTRRTALFDELVPASIKAVEVETIVRKLADARLITTDEVGGRDTVTISHEKLIDAWPWLKKLVEENREIIALQNEIAEDAREWENQNRDASYLYAGGRLLATEEKVRANKLLLSGLAAQFLQAAHTRRQRTRIAAMGVLGVIIVSLMVAALVFQSQASENNRLFREAETNRQQAEANAEAAREAQILAEESRAHAEEQARIARVGELAAQTIALREKQSLLSLLMGVEAYKAEDNARTRAALLDNLNLNSQIVQYLNGHKDIVVSVAFNPEGTVLASGSYDNTVILWDLQKRQPIGDPLEGHTGLVQSVAFSMDGEMLASGGDDNTVILWDVRTHEIIARLQGHTSSIRSVAFSPDGTLLASGSFDNTIILWDPQTRQRVGDPLTGHTDGVYSLAFSPDGSILATGSEDKTIILWDVQSRLPIGDPLQGHTDLVKAVAFSPDGRIVASGAEDTNIILWDVQTLEQMGEPLTGHLDTVRSLAFNRDGTILVSGSYDHTILLWNMKTRQRIGQPLQGHSNAIHGIAISPDGKLMASASDDTTVILWDMDTRVPLGQFLQGHSAPIQDVAFSPDSRLLASAGDDGGIILWNIETGAEDGRPITGYNERLFSLEFSPDGKILAAGYADGAILLWDTATRQPDSEPLQGHRRAVTSLSFSPDGRLLASGSVDQMIVLWNLSTRQPLDQPLAGHSQTIEELGFSPDGKILASASSDRSIMFWDVQTRQAMGSPLVGHTDRVSSIAFSPDGSLLASAGYDDNLILWDVKSRQPTGGPLIRHNDKVLSVVFSPDGSMLASGGFDKTIILWDVASRQPIGDPMKAHTHYVTSLAFSPDNTMLASGGADHSVMLWDLDPQSWIRKACQRASRNFTPAEWSQYFANEDYRATCP